MDIATDKLRHEEYKFVIRWKPFQLDSWLPEEGLNFKDYAVQKFGVAGMNRFLQGEVPFFERGKEVVMKQNMLHNTIRHFIVICRD